MNHQLSFGAELVLQRGSEAITIRLLAAPATGLVILCADAPDWEQTVERPSSEPEKRSQSSPNPRYECPGC